MKLKQIEQNSFNIGLRHGFKETTETRSMRLRLSLDTKAWTKRLAGWGQTFGLKVSIIIIIVLLL